jgi:TonB family protein
MFALMIAILLSGTNAPLATGCVDASGKTVKQLLEPGGYLPLICNGHGPIPDDRWPLPSVDYPSGPFRRNESGLVKFTLTVDRTGKVQSCAVNASSGSFELDAASCRFAARGKFLPATDANGSRVSGLYFSQLKWVIPAN